MKLTDYLSTLEREHKEHVRAHIEFEKRYLPERYEVEVEASKGLAEAHMTALENEMNALSMER